MTTRKTLTLSIEPSKSIPGLWVSTCVELDLVSQGRTVHQATQAICEGIAMIMAEDLARGLEPFDRGRQTFDVIHELTRANEAMRTKLVADRAARHESAERIRRRRVWQTPDALEGRLSVGRTESDRADFLREHRVRVMPHLLERCYDLPAPWYAVAFVCDQTYRYVDVDGSETVHHPRALVVQTRVEAQLILRGYAKETGVSEDMGAVVRIDDLKEFYSREDTW